MNTLTIHTAHNLETMTALVIEIYSSFTDHTDSSHKKWVRAYNIMYNKANTYIFAFFASPVIYINKITHIAPAGNLAFKLESSTGGLGA